MQKLRTSLHETIDLTEAQRATLQTAAATQVSSTLVLTVEDDDPESITIPLSLAAAECNFDAYIQIYLHNGVEPPPLTVDSGNYALILPSYDDVLKSAAGSNTYTMVEENAGTPFELDQKIEKKDRAHLLKGPIYVKDSANKSRKILDVTFFACVGNQGINAQTANFGAAFLDPKIGKDNDIRRTVVSPLAKLGKYRYVEFDYSLGESFCGVPEFTVFGGSSLVLHQNVPSGYVMLGTIPNFPLTAVYAQSLAIGGSPTNWAKNDHAPAYVDVGGGPAILSDKKKVVCKSIWPPEVVNPSYIPDSTEENYTSSTAAAVHLGLVGTNGATFDYTIDAHDMDIGSSPTLVMCEKTDFVTYNPGINLGGISALFVKILIDYNELRVGFMNK